MKVTDIYYSDKKGVILADSDNKDASKSISDLGIEKLEHCIRK